MTAATGPRVADRAALRSIGGGEAVDIVSQRQKRHLGAIGGVGTAMGWTVGTALFSSWFATGRKMEVSGPVASLLVMAGVSVILCFAVYELRVLPASSQKRDFYTGMAWSSLPCAIAAMSMFGITWLWRDQTGLNFNGVEAVIGIFAMFLLLLATELITYRDLGGGLR